MSEYRTIREREIDEMDLMSASVAKDQGPDTLYFLSLVQGFSMMIESACNVIQAQAKIHAIEINSLKEKIAGPEEMAAIQRLFAIVETTKEIKKNAAQVSALFHSRIMD